MRVDSVGGLGGLLKVWSIIDATPPNAGDFEIIGRGDNEWKLSFGDSLWRTPIPTDYFELNQPSTGMHMFYLTFDTNVLSDVPPNFRVHTKTTCVSVDDKGLISLGQTYLDTFIWKDGGSPFIAGIAFVPFWESFYCEETLPF